MLDALFPRRFHIGKAGDGGRAKLAVNLILGLNRMALAEGLTFAERMGLDPKAFLAVAKGSASLVAGDGAPRAERCWRGISRRRAASSRR